MQPGKNRGQMGAGQRGAEVHIPLPVPDHDPMTVQVLRSGFQFFVAAFRRIRRQGQRKRKDGSKQQDGQFTHTDSPFS